MDRGSGFLPSLRRSGRDGLWIVVKHVKNFMEGFIEEKPEEISVVPEESFQLKPLHPGLYVNLELSLPHFLTMQIVHNTVIVPSEEVQSTVPVPPEDSPYEGQEDHEVLGSSLKQKYKAKAHEGSNGGQDDPEEVHKAPSMLAGEEEVPVLQDKGQDQLQTLGTQVSHAWPVPCQEEEELVTQVTQVSLTD